MTDTYLGLTVADAEHAATVFAGNIAQAYARAEARRQDEEFAATVRELASHRCPFPVTVTVTTPLYRVHVQAGGLMLAEAGLDDIARASSPWVVAHVLGAKAGETYAAMPTTELGDHITPGEN